MVQHMQTRMQAVVNSAGGRIAPLADLFVMLYLYLVSYLLVLEKMA